MSEATITAAGSRRRLKYGILVAVGVLGSVQLFYYFGWSGRLSAEGKTPLDLIIEGAPKDTVETDRACILLDRPFNSPAQSDFTRTLLKQWTECRTLDNTTAGWVVQHCTVPGSNPIQKEGEPMADSPSCYPGGYFRIQRLQAPVGEDTIATGTCQLKAGMTLAKDTNTNQYATSFLGPDTFRIVLAGPERLSLMQQQSLGDCTYAIPYTISRPGRFWVQKIVHTYQGYDALNETLSEQWSPHYLGTDLIDISARKQEQFYHFDVCPHCVSWVAIDEAQGLGGTRDICPRTAREQSRQYGIYKARMPIKSVRQAVGHPYEWVPARPRCRFYPDQKSFEAVVESDSDEVKAEKAEAAQCLQKNRSIYFVGDSHVRMLFSGVMQRLQGRSGSIDALIQDQKTHTSKVGNVAARNDFDETLSDTLARIRYTVLDEKDEDVEVPDLGALEDVDTVVVGFGEATGHWTTVEFTERAKKVLEGLLEVRKARQLASGGDKLNKMNNLKVIWMGLPAWTEVTAKEVTADWKTNHRILYWNKIVDGMVDNINTQVGGQGMIDRLSTFAITVPFKNSTQDHVHYISETPVDSLSAELIHKLDLCS